MLDKWQNHQPETFVCINKWQQTPDTVTIELQPLVGAESIDFKPGQFVSLGIRIDDKLLFRAYSISSTPQQSTLELTIKRVDGGKVSTYLVDTLAIGEKIQLLKPTGDFNCIDHPPENQSVLLISAGCGITPVYSMAKYWLEHNANIDICFIHVAKSPSQTLFFEQLNQLDRDNSHFNLQLLLKDKVNTDCHQGRLDKTWLEQLTPNLHQRTVYLCGPEGFMEDVSQYLQQLEFNMAQFFQESFTPIAATETLTTALTLNVPAFGQTLTANHGDNLAAALESAGLPLLVACRSGVCGSCRCKVTPNSVNSSSSMTLTAAEIEQGYVLACSSTLIDNTDVSF
ncbi:hybrid-cluster NAD(P)-dependent oxidoreductase [Photobacterium iliopiscarium]|uniref:hybrid-cluster NAD(P)-dependent oxidoreductase n=1 Tax=Photobacterium iliopiscarium TaxID=56192 RepID=UPI0005D37FDC|nr:hybrid-cluster NAD(P)-dependent oxidoreductase [Photobacterium iliopiscarium]KJG13431.1 oxidoreductase [Photobacterium iliopiscarium]PSU00034.1 hybrid-cluster NAD(P)-dependent oxidoreductase [Photobacterium iliopiscarium]PSV85236.1 hybrid-cluster NAD(P)-dependent oxidoreductase [Photobacterium iliopiscarium]